VLGIVDGRLAFGSHAERLSSLRQDSRVCSFAERVAMIEREDVGRRGGKGHVFPLRLISSIVLDGSLSTKLGGSVAAFR
jgi:hypothetical protein